MAFDMGWRQSGRQAGGKLFAPCLQLIEQGLPVLCDGVMAQFAQAREVIVQGEDSKRRASRQPRVAEGFPARVLFRSQGLGPVARPVAEQQLGITRVAERERPRAQFLWRRGAYLVEQALVGIGQEGAVQR